MSSSETFLGNQRTAQGVGPVSLGLWAELSPPWQRLSQDSPTFPGGGGDTEVGDRKAQPAGRASQPCHLVTAGSPSGPLSPPCPSPALWGHRVALGTEQLASPLLSLAPRTSSATRRTELSRAGRSAPGTSQRTKYSRCGAPARGLGAGRVSRCRIWASKVFRKKSRGRKGETERWIDTREGERKHPGSAHPALLDAHTAL